MVVAGAQCFAQVPVVLMLRPPVVEYFATEVHARRGTESLELTPLGYSHKAVTVDHQGTSEPDNEKCIVIPQGRLGRNAGAWFSGVSRLESSCVLRSVVLAMSVNLVPSKSTLSRCKNYVSAGRRRIHGGWLRGPCLLTPALPQGLPLQDLQFVQCHATGAPVGCVLSWDCCGEGTLRNSEGEPLHGPNRQGPCIWIIRLLTLG